MLLTLILAASIGQQPQVCATGTCPLQAAYTLAAPSPVSYYQPAPAYYAAPAACQSAGSCGQQATVRRGFHPFRGLFKGGCR